MSARFWNELTFYAVVGFLMTLIAIPVIAKWEEVLSWLQ